jgi:DNA-binding NtrC family response regulator
MTIPENETCPPAPELGQLDMGILTKEQKLAAVLDNIGQGKVSRSDAAEKLDISERHLNRLMKAHAVTRPPSPAHARAEDVEIRRQVRQAAALAVHNREMTIESAAEAAGCSERTLYRLLERYLPAVKS